jgi:hypothetical protein
MLEARGELLVWATVTAVVIALITRVRVWYQYQCLLAVHLIRLSQSCCTNFTSLASRGAAL